MRAGRLDRRVTLQKPTRTQDDFGQAVETWSDVATVWAGVRQTAGSEFLQAQSETNEQQIVFTMRYRADVRETWRVVWEGRNFDVIEVRQLGRRAGIEVMAHARSQLRATT